MVSRDSDALYPQQSYSGCPPKPHVLEDMGFKWGPSTPDRTGLQVLDNTDNTDNTGGGSVPNTKRSRDHSGPFFL